MSREQRRRVYLVSGGCGFLGRHLLRVLLEHEPHDVEEVRVFDKVTDPSLEQQSTAASESEEAGPQQEEAGPQQEEAGPQQEEAGPQQEEAGPQQEEAGPEQELHPFKRTKVVVIQGDITDYSQVLEASHGVDVFIHSASLVDVWHKVPEALIYSVNVKGTENVIQACVENGISSLLYTSSMEVIGPNHNGDPFVRGSEDTTYTVQNFMPYPRSKMEAERLVLQANGVTVNGGKTLCSCSLRPTGIYGEGHDLLRDFWEQCVSRGGVLVGGIPDETEHGRVYAGNVAWMHVLAARALRDKPERVGGEAYFCYDDSPYKSYENFNMEFFASSNFRRVRIPVLVLWLMAMVNDLLRWLLSPVHNYTPLLNRYTLSTACTSFTVGTDKAFRHFQYEPLYDWGECKRRTQRYVDSFAQGHVKGA